MAKKKQARRIPLLEWVSAAVGLVVTAILLGFLGWEVVRQDNHVPPLLDAVPVSVASEGEGKYFVVEVEVTNASYTTAASVEVEGSLGTGAAAQTSRASIAYVPGKSKRRAGLIFSSDPRRQQLQLRVTGYERP